MQTTWQNSCSKPGKGKRGIEGTRWLLASVAFPILANMALDENSNRTTLLFAQRAVAIRMVRTYRAVSTNVILVLARMVP